MTPTIKRIHTTVAIMSQDHKFTFDSSQHKLRYFPDLSAVLVDNTMIPMSNVREMILEPFGTPLDSPAETPVSAISPPKGLSTTNTPLMTPNSTSDNANPSGFVDGAEVQGWFTSTNTIQEPLAKEVTTVTKAQNKKNLRVKTARKLRVIEEDDETNIKS